MVPQEVSDTEEKVLRKAQFKATWVLQLLWYQRELRQFAGLLLSSNDLPFQREGGVRLKLASFKLHRRLAGGEAAVTSAPGETPGPLCLGGPGASAPCCGIMGRRGLVAQRDRGLAPSG